MFGMTFYTKNQVLNEWISVTTATASLTTWIYNWYFDYISRWPGVYQIFAEIDTSYKDDEGNTVWNNIEVHSALQTLKALIKEYYNTEIVPTLFEYEFLKWIL